MFWNVAENLWIYIEIKMCCMYKILLSFVQSSSSLYVLDCMQCSSIENNHIMVAEAHRNPSLQTLIAARGTWAEPKTFSKLLTSFQKYVFWCPTRDSDSTSFHCTYYKCMSFIYICFAYIHHMKKPLVSLQYGSSTGALWLNWYVSAYSNNENLPIINIVKLCITVFSC